MIVVNRSLQAAGRSGRQRLLEESSAPGRCEDSWQHCLPWHTAAAPPRLRASTPTRVSPRHTPSTPWTPR